MILFKEDWAKYPGANIDLETKNTSWIRICKLFKAMGVQNHLFPLALHNMELSGVDPYDSDLSNELKIAITLECKENPWYFFREVTRIPAKGSPDGIRISANRANISVWWLFFNHVTTLLLQPRQTGKTLTSNLLNSYILALAGNNIDIHLLTKDDALRIKTVQDIKDVIESLPWYLQLKNRSDSYNTEMVTINALGNKYRTAVAQPSIKGANNMARGFTIPVHHIDEFAFIKNIEISLPVLLASATQARPLAKQNKSFYGNLFTTTAGYLSSPEGMFAYNVYKECLPWTELLFDSKDEEDLHNKIKINSPSGKSQVLCEYNHRQLGYTDEWLKETIQNNMAYGTKAETEYLNIWQEGNESSPISKELLKKINDSLVKDPIIDITEYGYIIRWYVSQSEVDNKLENRKLIIGLDTSDAIGNDDIAMCIRDVMTGEVVGFGVYNETNLITFANWLVDFLIEYPNTTLVPERKSSGVTIIDNLILILPTKGEDPFTRIFNWVTNDADVNQEYYDVIMTPLVNRTESIYNKYRKHFGYATSASGRNARDNLYGLCFNMAVRYTGMYARDNTLIKQLNGLIRKNDRIDHRPGEHDDAVISWILSLFFLTQAKNLEHYGLSPRSILINVSNTIAEEQGGYDVVMERNRQEQIARKVDELIELAKIEQNYVKAENLINRAKMLSSELTEDVKNKFNLESVLNEIKTNKFKMTSRPYGQIRLFNTLYD
jgi:hypothetical protein